MSRKRSSVSFKSNTIKVKQSLGKGAVKGIQEACLDLLRRSVQQAPVDEGDLRGSASARVNDQEVAKGKTDGTVQATGGVPSLQAKQVEGRVGFNTPYALRQHEDVTANHPRGGNAKYLENPYTEGKQRYRDHIRKAIAEEVK